MNKDRLYFRINFNDMGGQIACSVSLVKTTLIRAENKMQNVLFNYDMTESQSFLIILEDSYQHKVFMVLTCCIF